MKTTSFNIGGFNFKVLHSYNYIAKQIEKYSSLADIIDYDFEISENDIQKEKDIAETKHYAGYFESIATYRKIAEWLPLNDAFVLHSACFDVDGVGVAFAAHSGTGKSTHMMRWMEYLGDRMTIVNGDKPIVRFFDDTQNNTDCHTEERSDEVSQRDSSLALRMTDNALRMTDNALRMTGESTQNYKADETLPNIPYAYGTPWNGKEKLGCNMRTPLKHICFIERSDKNYVEKAEKSAVVDRIFNQVYMPKDPMAVVKTMQLIDRLLSNCQLWIIHCNMDENAGEIAYKQIFEK